jgi:molybdopterin-guanine dinucleotide biosynthesis protein A
VVAGVVLLAGGEATRLPGKLALPSPDLPLVVRTYRNLAGERDIVLSRAATFDPALAALLPIPYVVDRSPARGPLAGLLTAFETVSWPLAFAIAGDMPFVDRAFLARLEAAWQPGDEALVPAYARDGATQIEPLAALYDRRAFLREGAHVLESRRGSIRLVLERLRTRYVETEDPRLFTNVNTPSDYAALRAQERQPA